MSVRVPIGNDAVHMKPHPDNEGFRWSRLIEPGFFVPLTACVMVVFLFTRTYLILSSTEPHEPL